MSYTDPAANPLETRRPVRWVTLGWGTLAAAAATLAALPFDRLMRGLVGPGRNVPGDPVQTAGPWHDVLFPPIHAAYLHLVPFALWTVLIIAMPDGRRRWQAVGLVVAGFAVRAGLELLTQMGQGWAGLINSALPILLLLALLTRFDNGVRMWYAYLVPVVLSQIITHLFKVLVGRERPKYAESPLDFHPLHDFVGRFESFPSGHTSAATAMAVLLAIYLPRYRFVFFMLAAIVAAQRIVTSAHWLSDTVAGAFVGVLAVWIGRTIFSPAHYVTSGRLPAPGPGK